MVLPTLVSTTHTQLDRLSYGYGKLGLSITPANCVNLVLHTAPQHKLHCVSKNDTDVAHYNFNAPQPILEIFGRDVAERVCYKMMICYPIFPNY